MNGEPKALDEQIEERGMKLGETALRKFHIAKFFRENTDRINSLCFSPSGDLLISSAEDDQIVIYDSEKGTIRRSLNSKKYGVDLIRFTHTKNTAVHSSTKIDDTIRYLSLHDNKYLRYFPGHTKKVTSLSMSPTDDTVLSASQDKTIRLWDLRSPNCQGFIQLQGKPVTVFDPDGLIFAAGINNECVKLYDLRSFDKAPFSSFKLPCEKDSEWSSVKFSPDGRTILITSFGSTIRLVDAFSGTLLQTFDGFTNNKNLHLEASFSPDSQFIFSGSTDGFIHIWNADSGQKVCELKGDHHTSPIQCVQFSPKSMMMVSACTNMAFWLPMMDE